MSTTEGIVAGVAAAGLTLAASWRQPAPPLAPLPRRVEMFRLLVPLLILAGSALSCWLVAREVLLFRSPREWPLDLACILAGGGLLAPGLYRPPGLASPRPRLHLLLLPALPLGGYLAAGSTGVCLVGIGAGWRLALQLFPTCPQPANQRAETTAGVAVGLAWGALGYAFIDGAQAGGPFLLWLGAMAGILPDLLDTLIACLRHRTDMHIVLDPLDPQPGIAAQALAGAVARCQASGRSLRVALYPAFSAVGKALPQQLIWDPPGMGVRVTAAGRTGTARLPCRITSHESYALDWSRCHVVLELSPGAGREVQVCSAAGQRGWTHSWIVAVELALVAGIAGGAPWAIVALGSMTSHLLLGQLGYEGAAWWWPIRRGRDPGWQYWPPDRARRALAGISWMAVVLVVWSLLPLACPALSRAPLVPTLLAGGLIPLLLWQRHQRRRPAPHPSR